MPTSTDKFEIAATLSLIALYWAICVGFGLLAGAALARSGVL